MLPKKHFFWGGGGQCIRSVNGSLKKHLEKHKILLQRTFHISITFTDQYIILQTTNSKKIRKIELLEQKNKISNNAHLESIHVVFQITCSAETVLIVLVNG